MPLKDFSENGLFWDDGDFDPQKDLVSTFKEISKATGFCLYLFLYDGEREYRFTFSHTNGGGDGPKCEDFFQSLAEKATCSCEEKKQRNLIGCPCGAKALCGTICVGEGDKHGCHSYWYVVVGGIRRREDETRAFATYDLVGSILERFNKCLTTAQVVKTKDILNAIIKVAPVIIFAKDKDGKYIKVNDAMCSFLGKDPEKLIGRTVFDCYEQGLAAKFHESDRRALESPEAITEKISLPDGEGRLRSGHISKKRFLDQHQNVAGLVGVFADTTELDEIRQKISRERTLLLTLINASPDLVCFKDSKGRWLLANTTCLKLFQLEGVDYVGKTDIELAELTHPIYRDAFKVCMISDRETWANRRLCRYEEEIPVPGQKEPRIFDIIKVPVIGDSGELNGILVIGRDITTLRQLEAERLKIEKKLFQAQRLESLGVLAGGVAHDFKNILAAILGNAELASIGLPDGHEVRKYLNGIINACEKGRHIVSQMLSFAGNEGVEEYSKIDLSKLIKENLTFMNTLLSKKASIKIELAENLPPIQGNVGQLTQILVNLVVNASEALPGGKGQLVVKTGVAHASAIEGGTYYKVLGGNCQEGEFVYLSVEDNGVGMDSDMLDKVFDPFFSTKFHGRGLGLSAVHGIVKQHRGCILIKTKKGQGTEFKVLFPALEEGYAERAVEKSEAISNTGDTRPGQEKKVGPPQRILVVDDEESIRTLLKEVLTKAGYNVEVAENGKEAIDIVANDPKRFHIILLDLYMPVMDGKETLEHLNRLGVEAKCFVSSGYCDPKLLAELKKLGVSGFLDKPYRLTQLLDLLQEHPGS
ncbi:MAG TPA: PAS domain-containing sensor histidine kinase [Dissulfuribacter thermophilus]|uniref:histidine kinase n=1 Tax=Dissulfuribacter thermophilus TaxID=1156395 RepID=A0A7V2WSK9_9BACT|nr:PAS domain-containing sensor histidine kinase [Dissulfuribacter thermophilus]